MLMTLHFNIPAILYDSNKIAYHHPHLQLKQSFRVPDFFTYVRQLTSRCKFYRPPHGELGNIFFCEKHHRYVLHSNKDRLEVNWLPNRVKTKFKLLRHLFESPVFLLTYVD